VDDYPIGTRIRILIDDWDEDHNGYERLSAYGTCGTLTSWTGEPGEELADLALDSGAWLRWTLYELNTDAEKVNPDAE